MQECGVARFNFLLPCVGVCSNIYVVERYNSCSTVV